jgi:hypothetical protein
MARSFNSTITEALAAVLTACVACSPGASDSGAKDAASSEASPDQDARTSNPETGLGDTSVEDTGEAADASNDAGAVRTVTEAGVDAMSPTDGPTLIDSPIAIPESGAEGSAPCDAGADTGGSTPLEAVAGSWSLSCGSSTDSLMLAPTGSFTDTGSNGQSSSGTFQPDGTFSGSGTPPPFTFSGNWALSGCNSLAVNWSWQVTGTGQSGTSACTGSRQ